MPSGQSRASSSPINANVVSDAPQIVGNEHMPFVKNMTALLLFPGAFQVLGYVHVPQLSAVVGRNEDRGLPCRREGSFERGVGHSRAASSTGVHAC